MFFLRIFQALEGIDYAIVGGLAVALHGAARGTVDLDIVLALKKSEFVALEKALEAAGLRSRLPVRAEEVFDFRTEYIQRRNLIAWSFVNPNRGDEIVDVILTHDRQKMKSETRLINGVTVKVVSKKDLIAMKKEAGRPQDMEDVRALESLP